jgi:hypothetical protein
VGYIVSRSQWDKLRERLEAKDGAAAVTKP